MILSPSQATTIFNRIFAPEQLRAAIVLEAISNAPPTGRILLKIDIEDFLEYRNPEFTLYPATAKIEEESFSNFCRAVRDRMNEWEDGEDFMDFYQPGLLLMAELRSYEDFYGALDLSRHPNPELEKAKVLLFGEIRSLPELRQEFYRDFLWWSEVDFSDEEEGEAIHSFLSSLLDFHDAALDVWTFAVLENWMKEIRQLHDPEDVSTEILVLDHFEYFWKNGGTLVADSLVKKLKGWRDELGEMIK